MLELEYDLCEEEKEEKYNARELIKKYQRFFKRKRISDTKVIMLEKFKQYTRITPKARYLLIDGLLGSIHTDTEEKPSIYDIKLTEGIIEQIKNSIKKNTHNKAFSEEFEVGVDDTVTYTFYPCDNKMEYDSLDEFFDFRFYDCYKDVE